MGRKKLLSLDVDSARVLMQEIYNDISQERHTANTIMKKMLTFMKDAEDMTTIGPIIKEQQKILTLCTDKKIALVKLQSILMKQVDGKKTGDGSKLSLTAEDRKILQEYLSSDNDEDNKKEDGTYYK